MPLKVVAFLDRVDERDSLQDLLECAHSCKAGLIEILNFVSSYLGEDLNIISEKLAVALKVHLLYPYIIRSP